MRENYCLVGDCRDSLRQLAAEGVKVQTCVTSPPYWGLRDYGTASWEGGDEGCDHLGPPGGGTGATGLQRDGRSEAARQGNAERVVANRQQQYRGVCKKCGARRVDSQLGLEATPEAFVVTMVEVFHLVRDVLADDGCLWLNLGDSYIANAGTQAPQTKDHKGSGYCGSNRNGQSCLKPKDLVGIPWRVALALQADGWYLRQDIIWAKPNPMPESVTDRCTKSHEYLFLLTKQARYYFDAEAIREPSERPDLLGKKRLSGVEGLVGQRNDVGRQHDYCNPAGRNRRSVWTIATQPFSEAHFAVFPEALVKPCILAGSRPGDPVLDPFMGSGTVAKVAQDLGRRWVGCELNPEYAKLIEERTRQQGLTLSEAP